MKKILIVLCSLIMILGSSITAFATESDNQTLYDYSFYVDRGTIGPNYSKEWSHIYEGTFSSNYPACVIVSTDSYNVTNYPEIMCSFNLKFYLPDYEKFSNANLVFSGNYKRYIYDNYSTVSGSLWKEENFVNSTSSSFLNFGIGYDGSYLFSCPVFANEDDALSYFKNGDDSGILNKPDYESISTYDETFGLTGFVADNTITASWTGTTHDDKASEYAEMFVELTAGYAYVDAPGQIATTEPYIGEYSILDKTFTKLQDELKKEDESIFLRYLEVTPYYKYESGWLVSPYKGKSCFVWLNLDGTVEKIDNQYIDVANGKYSSDIPTPKIVMDAQGYGFYFDNCSDNYYIELQGRWCTVDDIELLKKDLVWKYKYSSIINTELETWVSFSQKQSANVKHDLGVYGGKYFDDMLIAYPVENRSFYGGTNGVSNYFSGYDDALSTIKMLLSEKTSLYNGCEIYVRYWIVDENGVVQYGKWCHWFDDLAKSDGSSGSDLDDNLDSENQSDGGLTDEEKENIEDSGNSKSDPDISYDPGVGSQMTEDALEFISNLADGLGDLPTLFSELFSFLPSWVGVGIGVGLLLVVALRFLGR